MRRNQKRLRWEKGAASSQRHLSWYLSAWKIGWAQWKWERESSCRSYGFRYDLPATKNSPTSKANCNATRKGQCVALDSSKGEDDATGLKETLDDLDPWKLVCVLQLLCLPHPRDTSFGNAREHGEHRAARRRGWRRGDEDKRGEHVLFDGEASTTKSNSADKALGAWERDEHSSLSRYSLQLQVEGAMMPFFIFIFFYSFFSCFDEVPRLQFWVLIWTPPPVLGCVEAILFRAYRSRLRSVSSCGNLQNHSLGMSRNLTTLQGFHIHSILTYCKIIKKCCKFSRTLLLLRNSR